MSQVPYTQAFTHTHTQHSLTSLHPGTHSLTHSLTHALALSGLVAGLAWPGRRRRSRVIAAHHWVTPALADSILRSWFAATKGQRTEKGGGAPPCMLPAAIPTVHFDLLARPFKVAWLGRLEDGKRARGLR